MNHSKRKGVVTSSEIYKLIKKGRGKDSFSAPALTYIEEKRIERKLDRSLATNTWSKAIAWGHLMEKVCFDKLEMYYDLVSTETREHHDPEFKDLWKGTPDYVVIEKVISEQKSYQLKNFALYTDCLMKKDIGLLRENFPQEYWQIVSNCCISNMEIGEAISFMPYKSTLEDLRTKLNETDILDEWDLGMPWKYRYIIEDELIDLPYIEEGGYFKELTKFRFVIPEEDIEYLTERVREAGVLIRA